MSEESNIKYGMGQLRYNGNKGSYYDKLMTNVYQYNVNIGEGDSNNYFKDNVIKVDSPFELNSAYLLSFRIPKNSIYDCAYKIKLISGGISSNSGLHDRLSYQLIRYIAVPRQNGWNKSIRIVVFENPLPGSTQTMVSQAVTAPEWIHWGDEPNGGAVYPRSSVVLFKNNQYYLWRGQKNNGEWYSTDFSASGENPPKDTDNYIPIEKFEDVIIEPYWTSSEPDINNENDYVFYNIIFSFKGTDDVLNNCDTIWLELVRNNFDYDIINTVKNNQGTQTSFYGRYIELLPDDVSVYKLTNIMPTDISTVTNIGIYSHPNFMFAINNEELTIGPSGYFELNDYEINSITVAPIYENERDNVFTIDYQYLIEKANTETEETNN